MKKTAFILALVMLMGMAVVHAEIVQDIDKFTGGKEISSIYAPNRQEPGVSISKVISGNIISYEIGFFDRALSGEKFTKDPVEIKIDDYPIQTIPVTEVSSMPTDVSNKNITWNRNKAPVSQNIIDQIKVAKRVALKVHRDKFSPAVIVLSDEALAEWKQVISMEK